MKVCQAEMFCESHSSIFIHVYTADYQSLPAKGDDSYGDSRESLYNGELTAARPMKVHQTLTWFEYCKRYQHLTCS